MGDARKELLEKVATEHARAAFALGYRHSIGGLPDEPWHYIALHVEDFDPESDDCILYADAFAVEMLCLQAMEKKTARTK